MKQPDLGKMISKLRNEKGLTQEELVEKCNISVRTIQRIENGEVSPRTYTIKTILAALEVDFNLLNDVDTFSLPDKVSKQVKKVILVSGIAGILYFLLGFIEVPLEIARMDSLIFSSFEDINNFQYSLLKTFVCVSCLLFFYGFYFIGKSFELNFLKICALINLILFSILPIIDVIAIEVEFLNSNYILVSESVLAGSVMLIFSIGIWQMNKFSPTTAKITAIVTAMNAILFISVFFAIPALFLLTITEIFQIVLLFKVYNHLNKVPHLAPSL